MGKLKKFWRFPFPEKVLLLEAAAFVIASRILLWFRNSKTAWEPVFLPFPRANVEKAERVAWAVSATAAFVPHASCLTQALAGREMLRRRGIGSEIRIGVKAGAEFQAHAWLVIDGRILLGGTVSTDFAELGALPDR